ncbi:NUDIX hydrolase [Thiobacter aerophilum]|uniref:NUDIX domain-containing protein n=1 Tax=Thiobacter aerophilum TaxID=3121275 RepID=A0ABV0EET6_9BURK
MTRNEAVAPYCYSHPHPAVTTDVVLFTIREETLQVLLVRRRNAPFAGQWALPGGFLDPAEDLITCALRELAEETGITDVYLEQLYTFGRPDRDPRGRVISVTYYGLAPADRLTLKAGSDAKQTAWFPYGALPPLAFDHREIVDKAHERLVAKLEYSTIAFQFLPAQFTLSELQEVYEIIRSEPLDKRNFRKWVLARNLIEETGAQRRNGSHRPAKLFRTKYPGRVEIIR